jgi:type IV pilus assembly protein PilE
MRCKNFRKQVGFTLIEIVIVVALIGILATIALPSYSEYVRRGERSEARTIMLEASHWMERRFTVHHSYLSGDGGIPVIPSGMSQSPKTGTAKYVIGLMAEGTTLTTYKLQAMPQRGDKCGTFMLDQSGARSLRGNIASVEECWRR